MILNEFYHMNQDKYTVLNTIPSCYGADPDNYELLSYYGLNLQCVQVPHDNISWQTTKADKTDLDTKLNKSDFEYIFDSGKSITVWNNTSVINSVDWYGSYSHRTNTSIVNGTRPYQISLNISNSTGTNNDTTIFCNGHCNTGFTDIRFTLGNTTILPYWIENNATGKVWVNVTANGTVNMYYGNPSAIDASNGTNTFDFFDDFDNLNQWTKQSGTWTTTNSTILMPNSALAYLRSNIIAPTTPYVLSTKFSGNWTGGSTTFRFLTEANNTTSVSNAYMPYNTGTSQTLYVNNGNGQSVSYTLSNNVQYIDDFVFNSTTSTKLNLYDTSRNLLATVSNTVATSGTGHYFALFDNGDGTQRYVYWMFIRKYITTEPTWSTWGAEETIQITQYNNSTALIAYDMINITNISTYGNLGIKTTNLTSALHVGNAGDGNMAWSNSWNVYSSEKYKTDIKNITFDINFKLTPISYIQKDDKTNTTMYGFISEDLPIGVKVNDGNNTGINIMGLIAYQSDIINRQQKILDNICKNKPDLCV